MCLKSVAQFKTGSHILPRSFLKPIRASGSGQISVINVFDAVIDRRQQDLPKGDFICADCEMLTAKWDGYGANVLKEVIPSIKKSIAGLWSLRVEIWSGIDFLAFRNFLLSIVVRDHAWRKSGRHPLLMNDAEFERMRMLLMGSDATDDSTCPIIIHKIVPVPMIKSLHKTTSPPTQSDAKDAVTFLGMGFGFMVYFKRPTIPGQPYFVDAYKLQKEGRIQMVLSNLFHLGTWKKSHDSILKAMGKSSNE